MAQIWAHLAASLHSIPVRCLSGGVEVTAFSKQAIAALHRQGFVIPEQSGTNPKYAVSFSPEEDPLIAYSKLYHHPINQHGEFAAVMVCADVDESCPLIPEAEKRIPIFYDDPKEFDNTEWEQAMYDERANQIGSEMLYVFSKIRTKA